MSSFQKIALYARLSNTKILEAAHQLALNLIQEGFHVVAYEALIKEAQLPEQVQPCALDQLHYEAELMVAVGGDGSLIEAAKVAVNQNLPLVGVNRGKLGFLTDIAANDIQSLLDVLHGAYEEEQRFLLDIDAPEALIKDPHDIDHQALAINEILITRGKAVGLLDFDIYVNNTLMCSQSADGLILATPTGSTAYALSAGGPIMHSALDAILLMPLCPHRLTSRPIVLDANDEIRIAFNPASDTQADASCDGQSRIPIPHGGEVLIRKHRQSLRLIHPKNYEYFQTLRTKLYWERKHANPDTYQKLQHH